MQSKDNFLKDSAASALNWNELNCLTKIMKTFVSKASKPGSQRPPMGKITNQQSRRQWEPQRRETNDFKQKQPTQTQLRIPERNKRPYKTSQLQLMGSS